MVKKLSKSTAETLLPKNTSFCSFFGYLIRKSYFPFAGCYLQVLTKGGYDRGSHKLSIKIFLKPFMYPS